jgi:hypothetical protein
MSPKNIQIAPSPITSSFQGIGGTANALGYVVIPTYFPNKAAMANDTRSAKSYYSGSNIKLHPVSQIP